MRKVFKVTLLAAALFGALAMFEGAAQAVYNQTRFLQFDLLTTSTQKKFIITARQALLDRYVLASCEKRYGDTLAVWYRKIPGQDAINKQDAVQHSSIYYRAALSTFSSDELVLIVEVLDGILQHAANPRCNVPSAGRAVVVLDRTS